MTATAEHTTATNVFPPQRHAGPVPPKWRVFADSADPRKDPEWVLRAAWFYIDDGTTPDEAYDEFVQHHGAGVA